MLCKIKLSKICFVFDENKFRSWRIQILQFECDSTDLAPEGCLQYYSGLFSFYIFLLIDQIID